jgi:hypothetical protein
MPIENKPEKSKARHRQMVEITRFLADPSLLEEFSRKALSFSRQFLWGTTADAFDKLLRRLSLIKCSSDKQSNKLCLESVR